MIGLVISFVAGLLIADFAWAWKTRTVHRVWRRLFPAPVTYVTYTGCEHCEHCHPTENVDEEYADEYANEIL